MTVNDFRRIALAMPEATEGFHMGHPDFRVGGRIFATLGYPDLGWGMVKLNPEQQHECTHSEPEAFVPVKGGWGRKGATSVRLKKARAATLRSAMAAAWRNTAPAKLAQPKQSKKS